ncbi:hypothetical protein G7046_g5213 [Stylonectria norvegica]|nr:hypothetical protein G7046_g5213 [Stylonectria norvegica]
MPQDPNLYGQRPLKKQKRDAALSGSLNFTAQLTSLLSNSGSGGTTTGRQRPSKERKDDIFRGNNQKRQHATRDESAKLVLKEVAGTEDETRELARAKRRMEEKARLYAAMKRGDYVPKENEAAPLIDFDRKWAEEVEGGKEDQSSSSGDDNDADDGGEMVEYEDEFGRVRQVTKAEKEALERRARRGPQW